VSDRYASHELSKKLAEAGLVTTGYHVWCLRFGRPSVEEWCHQEDSGRTLCTGADHVRALDLTDTLAEIRRRMQPSRERILMTDDGETCDVRIESVDVDWMERASGKSLVEAAGLVLLTMLKERRRV